MGRKPTIIICSVGGAIGVVKIFIKNYYAYLGVEFFESFLASGLYTVAVVLRKLSPTYVLFICINHSLPTKRKIFDFKVFLPRDLARFPATGSWFHLIV